MIPTANCTIRYAKFDDLCLDSPATAEAWLASAEHRLWSRMRSPSRQLTFLAGRMLAKQMLREKFAMLRSSVPRKVTIKSCNRKSRGCRPTVEFLGKPLNLSLSIAHNSYGVLVAGTYRKSMEIGVDLVSRQHLGAAFKRTWFTSAETVLLPDDTDHAGAAELWAMKEATYKACNTGEPFQPRRMEMHRWQDRWKVRYSGQDLDNRCLICTWPWGNEFAALALYQKSGLPAKQSIRLDLQSSSLVHTTGIES